MRRPTTLADREHRLAVFVSERRQVLLRIDPAVHDALMRWADDELRSLNAQIEMLLRRALTGRRPHAQTCPAPTQTRTTPNHQHTDIEPARSHATREMTGRINRIGRITDR
jgi:hypothetical protein